MNSKTDPLISICLCTYKRVDKLTQCLQSIRDQIFNGSIQVILTENDSNCSSKPVFNFFEKSFQQAGIELEYVIEPIQNIALARNRALKHATGEYIAFIDDDERAVPNWLQSLFIVMTKTNSDGVWGPVTPELPDSFPEWMKEYNIFDRNNPADCSIMDNYSLRTGNALIKRRLLELRPGPFDAKLGKTGGEDFDLFNFIRAREQSAKFVWSKDAEVIEMLEDERGKIRWHLRRAYRACWVITRSQNHQFDGKKSGFNSFIRIIPSFIKAQGKVIRNLNNIRYANYLFLCSVFSMLGKIGYFFGVKVEEYNGG